MIRYIPAFMQDAPQIDVIFLLDIKGQVRKPANLLEPETRDIQRVRITGRSGARAFADQFNVFFQRIDKSVGHLDGFAGIVIDGFFDIFIGSSTTNNRFPVHF